MLFRSNDAKGHYENHRVLTEMLQNNIPVEGTIQKAYGMHYDFVTQDGKTVRFYNQATHDPVIIACFCFATSAQDRTSSVVPE